LGFRKGGPFDVSGEIARQWLALPTNPNGRSNSDVLKPYWNGDDVTSRPRDVWFIDLPLGLREGEAALFEKPFGYLETTRYDPESKKDFRSLREARATVRDRHARDRWWEPYWPRPEMRRRITALQRYIVTTETSEHRLFVWLYHPILPDKNLIVIVHSDDTSFGILHSRAFMRFGRSGLERAWRTGPATLLPPPSKPSPSPRD
jgi:hypothetical protein